MNRFRHRALLAFAAGAIVVLGTIALLGGSYRHSLFEESRLREIATLSPDNPQVALADLLQQRWDYACFVPPYYAVAEDAKLAGVEIAWIADDSRLTVVLKRSADYSLHAVSRGDVVAFRLEGLSDGEVCYDTTAVTLRHVAGDGPIVVSVTPQD